MRSAQQQLATWGIRTAAALCVASRTSDRFGLANFKEPSIGVVLSSLLALHLGACVFVRLRLSVLTPAMQLCVRCLAAAETAEAGMAARLAVLAEAPWAEEAGLPRRRLQRH